MHLDFGQLHPAGLSCNGPSSSVAVQRRSSLSKRLSSGSRVLVRFARGDDGEELLDSIERLPMLLSSVGDEDSLETVETVISRGITMLLGITTREIGAPKAGRRPPLVELVCPVMWGRP